MARIRHYLLVALVFYCVSLGPAAEAPRHRIAVLPFTDEKAPPELSWLSRGIPSSLWADPSAVRSVSVLPRGTVYRFLERLPPSRLKRQPVPSSPSSVVIG